LSEQFGITKGDDDGWFDPILGQDTLLAVDPYLDGAGAAVEEASILRLVAGVRVLTFS
jgi:hypothetical protein